MSEEKFSKSAKCGDGACVEVAFVKSSTCGDSACVEMGNAPHAVLLRNSTEPDNVIPFDKEAWRGFLADIRDGEFDL